MTHLLQLLFQLASRIGRRFGGLRPHRFLFQLGEQAYSLHSPKIDEYRWWTDLWGSKLFLHPYYFIDRVIIATGTYEPELHRFLEKTIEPNWVCCDVGANLGVFTVHLAKLVGPQGKVFAFEPVPRIRELLERNVGRNGYASRTTVLPVAVSDRVGSVTMNAASESTSNQGMASILASVGDVEVESTTLDLFCAGNDLKRLDFLKIDIQGAEPLLLDGAENTLNELRPIIAMEVSPDELFLGDSDSQRLIAKLEKSGYQVYALTQNGCLGSKLVSSSMAVDFYASNVIAIPSIRKV